MTTLSAILVPLLSIWGLGALAWAARRALRLPLCPICVGVAGTWIWMLIGRALGVAIDTSMLALLLGGSVVGIAYQLERRLAAENESMPWKTLVIPLGFAAAYALEQALWGLLAAILFALAAVGAVFFRPRSAVAPDSATVEELKRQMKQCC